MNSFGFSILPHQFPGFLPDDIWLLDSLGWTWRLITCKSTGEFFDICFVKLWEQFTLALLIPPHIFVTFSLIYRISIHMYTYVYIYIIIFIILYNMYPTNIMLKHSTLRVGLARWQYEGLVEVASSNVAMGPWVLVSSDDTIDVKLMFSTCKLRGASISQWKAWRMLGSSILKGKIILYNIL